jgi:dTDP-4-amino-4,6-dideoxygalactose transaminase
MGAEHISRSHVRGVVAFGALRFAMTKSDGKAQRFLPFGGPILGEEEISEVVETLRSGWIGTGPRVARFEADFARYKAVEEGAAVGSCTAALHLSLLAAGAGPGTEVITTPLTFCATVNAIVHTGATPVLADVDPVSMNLDPEAVGAAVTPRTRVILPVHFAGRPCDMPSLGAIAERHGLAIVEDCAHAVETEAPWGKAGTFGDFGCFSFYATKNLTTGEGGMVLARKPEGLAHIRRLALHGLSRDAWRRFSADGYRHYQVVEAGWKYNMTDVQAAIGIHQLARLEASWRRREELWHRYMTHLADLPVELPAPVPDDERHAYHLFTLQVSEERSGIARDAFLDHMTAHGIGVGVHYLSVPEHPFYQERFGWRPEQWPHAMRIGRSTVSLPLTPYLSDADVGRVLTAVHQGFVRGGRDGS